MTDRPTEAESPSPSRRAPTTGHDLLRLAVKSGLLSDEQGREFLTRHPLAAGTLDPPEFCRLIVTEGLLPRLVADLLLIGYPDGLTLPRYRLVELIGRGGMASVFAAEDGLLRRRVAVKVMHARDGRDDMRERFAREVLAAAAVNHPNFVRTYDGGEHAGVPFLVMELLTGRTLYAIRRRGPVSVAQAIDFVSQAARGLEAVHAAGLVHRDVKPGNLMRCDDGTVKLLDLGLARYAGRGSAAAGEEHTSLTRRLPALSFLGTPEYLAPEQMTDSAAADHRADVYGLGATLFHLVAGRPPRAGVPLGDPPPDLAALRPDVPSALARLVARMMASDPDDRPQTARAVIDELAAVPCDPDTSPNSRARTTVVPVIPSRPPAPPRRRGWWWVVAVFVLGVVALALVFRSRPPAAVVQPPSPRFAVEDAGEVARFDEPVRCVAASPDGRFTAVVLAGGRTALHDAVGGAVTWLPGGKAVGQGVGFAAGGSKLAYPSGLRAATVWNLSARTPECVVECEDVLVGVAIRADGRFLATGERGGRIRVRDMGGGAEWRTNTPNNLPVAGLTFRPAADEVLYAAQPLPLVGKWAWVSTSHSTAGVGPGLPIGGQLHAMPGDRIAILLTERLAVHDARTLAFRRLVPESSDTPKLSCVAAGPWERLVVGGGHDGRVCVWDTHSGTELAAAAVGAKRAGSVAVSPSGATAVVGFADGSVRRVRIAVPE